MEFSDPVVIEGHYWKLCGPFASLSDTCSPLKIYDGCNQNWIDDLNVSDDLSVTDHLLNLLPGLICDLCSCGHLAFYVYYHCSI